jgi:hypothetical protein
MLPTPQIIMPRCSPALTHALILSACALFPFAPLAAQSWSQRNTLTAPSPRNSHAMAFDLDRGVAVVFGGYNGTNVALGDTWESNPIGWVRRTVAVAPPAR